MESPLVSIIVITYNSSQTIIDTLNSINGQSYSNIELIISDDASTDDTISLCKEWIKNNSSRFIQYYINVNSTNLGVTKNCNAGCTLAHGHWIKLIAGDDALLSNAITEFMAFSQKFPQAEIIHSRILIYKNNFNDSSLLDTNITYPIYFTDNKPQNAILQHQYLCLQNTIAAGSVIIKKALYEQVKGFDERIGNCEDWPMWLKITNQGHSFYFMDSPTFKYRLTTTSIYGKETINYLFKRFYNTENKIYKLHIKPYSPPIYKFMNRYNFYLRLCLDQIGLNKNRIYAKIIYSILNIPYIFFYKQILKTTF